MEGQGSMAAHGARRRRRCDKEKRRRERCIGPGMKNPTERTYFPLRNLSSSSSSFSSSSCSSVSSSSFKASLKARRATHYNITQERSKTWPNRSTHNRSKTRCLIMKTSIENKMFEGNNVYKLISVGLYLEPLKHGYIFTEKLKIWLRVQKRIARVSRKKS